MKKTFFMLILILAVFGSGCAPTQEAVDSYPPDLRSKYIAALEKEAAESYTKIYWVKAPSSEQLESRLRQRSPKHN